MTDLIKPQGYDIIGDIHGHADKLIALLEKMGYSNNGDCYRHPSRQVIFLGDFIDRGPQQRKTLETVMPMVKLGAALSVMGNHEYNALAYHTAHPKKPNTWLRPRSDKNMKQHKAFIEEYIENGNVEDLEEVLEFFRSLPLWLELDELRVVHAAWHQPSMEVLSENLTDKNTLTAHCLIESSKKGTQMYEAAETVLKGIELTLPQGLSHKDKDGTERTEVRCWFFKDSAKTLADIIVHPDHFSEEIQTSTINADMLAGYGEHEKPIFVGHYWMSKAALESPKKLTDNIACVDYSAGKGGDLVAYRWNGESRLRDTNFIY